MDPKYNTYNAMRMIEQIAKELMEQKRKAGHPVVSGSSPKSYGMPEYSEIGPRFDSKPTQEK